MADIAITTNSKILNEVAGNNGAIANTITFKAAGGTFAGDNGDALGTITGVPDGLTAVLVKTSATTAKLVLKGTAKAHSNAADAIANGGGGDGNVVDIEATTANVAPVAQVTTLTLGGTFAADDVITVTGVADADVKYTVLAEDVTGNDAADAETIAAKLVATITVASGSKVDAAVVDAAGSTDGQLTLTDKTPGTGFTAAATTVSSRIIADEVTTANDAAVAQVTTLTLDGTFAAGDVITVTGVAGSDVTYTVLDTDVTGDDAADAVVIAAKLAQAIADASDETVDASATDNVLTLTAKTPGTGFTAAATTVSSRTIADETTTDNVEPVAQVATLTLSGTYAAGDTITVTGVAGSDVTYLVLTEDVTGDDAADAVAIAAKLAQAIADASDETVDASATDNVLTLTAKTPGTGFTPAVTVSNPPAGGGDGLTITFAPEDFATGDYPSAGLVVNNIDFDFNDPAEAGTLTLVPPKGADTTGVYSAGSKTNTFENLPTISGTGKADDKIYIYSNGGTKPLNATQPVTVDKDGKWELDLSGLKFKDGAHVVTASTSIDGKGAMSAPFAFTVDSKAPSAPSVTAIKGAISDTTPVLTGKAEKFATVKVYSSETQTDPVFAEDGITVTNPTAVTLLGTTTANAKGVWTLAVTGNQLVVEDPKANNQTFKISALAIDAAGNSTKSKKTVDLTIDTKIDTPTLEATTVAKKNTVALKGKVEGETGGTLQLYGGEDGSVPLGKVIKIAKDGSWKSSIKLTDGVHKLSVVATDAAGNVSDNSVIDDKTTVTIDTFTATPTLELDKDGSGNVIGVKGTAEAGAKVKITIGKKTLEAEALADGTWSKSFDGFTPDSTTKAQTIKAVATDTATNVSKPSTAVTHTFTASSGGGGTFAVTEGGAAGGTGTVTFSNAAGAVTLTINNDGNLVFTDTTPTAKTSTYKVADMAAGGIPAVTMSAATFANLADKLADNSATLGAVTTNVDDVITNIAKVKADGIESITLSATQTTATNLAAAALKAGSVTVTEALTGQAATDALGALTKFKANGIESITLSEAQTTAANLADAALKAGSVTVTEALADQAATDALGALAKFKADGIESITLTAAQTTEANLDNAALKAGSVTVTDALTGQAATDALANLTKFKADGIESITLSAEQTTAENLGNAALKAGSVTVTDALTGEAATDALANLTKFKADGIASITLSDAQFLGADGIKIALNDALLDGALTVNGADTGVEITATGYTKGLKLNGGAGNDTITGGAGKDVLTGGDGADTFKFSTGDSAATTTDADSITDLTVGDKIDLSAINSGTINFITDSTASALDGTDIAFTAGFDVFVGTVDGQAYLFYETTAQGADATDAGTLEVVGIDIVGTLANWTETGGVITTVA